MLRHPLILLGEQAVQSDEHVSGIPLSVTINKRYPKRIFDIFFSAILLIMLMPLMVAVAVLVCCFNFRNPFFLQARVGLARQPFTVLKFRTLECIECSDGSGSAPEWRYLRFGKFMRQTGIDELPQLFNVLSGSMSLVGPRPHTADESEQLFTLCRARFDVLPGLTGLAQISGRQGISLERKSVLDKAYIRHMSFAMDMRIIVATLLIVIRGLMIGSGRDY